MSIQSHKLADQIELVDLQIPVVLEIDPAATSITVDLQDVEDDAVKVTTTPTGSLLIKGNPASSAHGATVVQQGPGGRITITQSGGDVNLSGISINGDNITVGGSTFTADGDVTIVSSSSKSIFSGLLGGRRKSVITGSATSAAGKVIVTAPAAAISIRNCQEVIGEISGPLEANLDGMQSLTLTGATEAEVDADGHSTAVLTEVRGDVTIDTDGMAKVRVDGTAAEVDINADGHSKVDLTGTTGTGSLRIKADGMSKVQVTGDVGEVRIDVDGHSEARLHGTCQDGKVSADGMGKAFVTRALGRVRERTNSRMATVQVG